MRACSDTSINGLAGGGTSSLGPGAGGSVDSGLVKKITEAYVHGNPVEANRDVEIRALSSELLTSTSFNAIAAPSVGIGGAGELYAFDLTTRAYVSHSGVVTAQGSVVIEADDHLDLDFLAGVGTLPAFFGTAGAAAAAVHLDKTTEAFIDEEA